MTVTASGELNPDSQFFTAGEADVARFVFCPDRAAVELARRLKGLAGVEVVGTGKRADKTAVLSGLKARGIGRLLAEGLSRKRIAAVSGTSNVSGRLMGRRVLGKALGRVWPAEGPYIEC